MVEEEVVTARTREGKFNKNAARRVRMKGMIPGVIYGAQEKAIAIELDPKQIARILQSASGHNTIFDVAIADSGPAKAQTKASTKAPSEAATKAATRAPTRAMIVDWQYEPIKGSLMHIDLKRIAMDKAIRVKVPIQLSGIPLGVKTQGGVLDQVLREVEVECLPADIPSALTVDVTALGLNDALRVADLPQTGKLKFLTDEHATVAHVAAIKEEIVAPVEAVAEAAPAEPEVAKKGKQETTEAAPPAEAKGAKPAETKGAKK